MRLLKRMPDDRRDRYTLLRLGAINYCEDECEPHYSLLSTIECWESTLEQVLDSDWVDNWPS